MLPRHSRPVCSLLIVILAMLACNMPSAPTKAPVAPTSVPVDATKIALEIQATNNMIPPTQGVDATKVALEVQATNNAPTSTRPVDATKVALEVQATDASAQLTRQANQPTVAVPPPQQLQPTVGLPPAASSQDFKERMKTAKILVYEDTNNIGNWISDALDTMGLKYTFVGDAVGTLMINLNSPIDWDLIIIGAESRTRVQGEFWDVINEKVARDNAGLIAEVWYLDLLGEGKIKPLLANCGVQYQQNFVRMESVYWLDSTNILFKDPNNAMPLINYVNYWDYDHGDLLRLSPGSDALLLAGTFAKRKSDYGVLASCLGGRVVIQTFCNHDFNHDAIIRLWQNYITYVLKNRFALKP